MADLIQEIKSAIASKNLVIGKNSVIDSLKKNELKKVILASNVPNDFKENIEYYCSFNEIECMVSDKSNEELGVICRESFFISVLGIKN